MRVLFVITRGDDVGGAQSYVRDLSARMVRDRHPVMVAVGSAGPLTDALSASGVDWAVVPGLSREVHPVHDTRAVRGLRELMRRFEPDLVSAHSSKGGTVGRLAARLSRIPCVFTVHGWAFNAGSASGRQSLFRGVERSLAPLATRIICVSEHDRSIGIAAGIAPWRLVTIENGIPDLVDRPARPAATTETARVTMVARFAPPKDHDTLIRAIANVPGAVLDLIGDGPGLPAAATLVEQLGLRDRVRFHGRRQDVPDLLATSDIFVLSSRSEGFPLSTLEAMRAGLPAVVTRVGGAPEAVIQGETGFIIPAGDVDGMRAALTRLVVDTDLRGQMGAAARSRFETRYTFRQMHERTLQVYRQAIRSAETARNSNTEDAMSPVPDGGPLRR